MDDVWSDPQAITGEPFVPFSHRKSSLMSMRLLARLKEWESNGTGKIAHKSAMMSFLLLCVADISITVELKP